MIEPTCILCKGKLGFGQPMYDKVDFSIVSETYVCRKCDVNQIFATNGQPLQYSFQVKPYTLVFDLKNNEFTIRDNLNYNKPLMKLNHIPHNLTPSTVTLEKIKTLILFS